MKNKMDVVTWLDAHQVEFTRMADEIWANPELAFEEFKASKLQADYLASQGFTITWDVGGVSTAFMAEWGEGQPILGFAGEYDALPGLSQKQQTSQEPVNAGAPGHGCGHNLLGTGCLAGAVATQKWLQATGQAGTVRYYGCPAEENGSGKIYMALAGAFDDLDAAFNFHPGWANYAGKGSWIAVSDIKFRFWGKSAHAAAMPHLGRSALDAVELMNVGVNYLREHILESIRIHYVITDGGQAPNVVPETAQSWYFIRAETLDELNEVVARIRKIAQGAALMTETRLEETVQAGASNMLSNHVLADLQYDSMKLLGPIEFTPAENAFAEALAANYPPSTKKFMADAFGIPIKVLSRPLVGDVFPSLDEGRVLSASTDVGDLSWKAPVSMLMTACFPTSVAIHSWGAVASAGSSIGHKGMLYAAKVMALSAIELYLSPEKLRAVRAEFEVKVAESPYIPPVPEDARPPEVKHPYR
ncbi:MAG TPA: amidohydrolase [Chloroflexi bacterium]|nr:amidohydrolase [Chloroflexota bacterium]